MNMCNLIIKQRMEKGNDNRVCPVELAGGLDNSIRKFLQNPGKILKPYIEKDMTVLDFGCGPGFFTIEIARMLSDKGRVIAADLQSGMLDKLRKKISGTVLEEKVILHKCEQDRIGITESVDFILAFYVIHEVPEKEKLFREFKSILKPGGKILIIEPNFHVTKNAFGDMIEKIEAVDMEISERPKYFMNRAVLIRKK
jgi:ubiquinone/menaquinone biosynthesis C-methylase UbiE